jgi:hypothetical protein
VFERFTERARQVVVLAQDEARALRHNYIGTEHILLGLLREEEGFATRVLGSLGIDLEGVRAEVVRIVGQGDEAVTGQIPFTARAKKTLELSMREALSLHNNYIGTEHILLALLRETESRAVEVLTHFGADAEKVRDRVIRMIGGNGAGQTSESFPPGEESPIEQALRRVVPVAQQIADGTWVVSVEIWDQGLTLRWATSKRPPVNVGTGGRYLSWLIFDDVGTSYTMRGEGGSGGWQHVFRYEGYFAPAPPPEAKSLLIRREATNEELSISLTD